ncbi:serine protease 30-like [Drosophila elegans]|uniref:serine protease 30-like n=1 Tax=Drosophila elegans TaxID=30023 RepID=UPI0007E8A077|nr:serine protease 30-like [Drosophila elegans]
MSVFSSALFAILLFHQGLAYLLEPNCKGHVELVYKVQGGNNALGYHTPFMVSLYDKTRKFIAGGSLIHKRFVLTAGHVLSEDPKFVRLGEKDRTCENWNCSIVQEYLVEKALRHPRNKLIFENDIGLLRLNAHVEYNKDIQPICIIVDDAVNFKNVEKLRAFGWGRTSSTEKLSDMLKTILLKREDPSVCELSVGASPTEQQFCASDADGHGDTCPGDSGGPLVADFTYEGRKSYTQIGIVSYGSQSCNASSIYTDVASHQAWIAEMVHTHEEHLLFENCSSHWTGNIAVRLWETTILKRTVAGTLITDEFVVTVASALQTNFTDIKVKGRYFEIEVAQIIKHPEFSHSRGSIKNNIALLKLKNKVEMSDLVKPVCLAVNSFPSQTFTALLEAYNRTISIGLKRIPFTPTKDCSRTIGMPVESNQFCVEQPRDYKYERPGSVMGTYKEVKDVMRYLLTGIISHVINGMLVFTNVETYEDWIRKNIM